jgi:hypothetical protein
LALTPGGGDPPQRLPAELASREPEFLEVRGNLEKPDVGRNLDLFREKLTSRLLWLFGSTVIADVVLASVAAATGHDVTSARDLLHDVIPAETGLLGAAIGYYFGERAAK